MFLSVFQPLSGELQQIIREIIPKKIWFEFSEERISNLNVTRMEILASAYKISQLNPIFGLGAGSFPIIYEIQKNLWRGHPHNIILELAISFGYPATILFVLTISVLIGMSAINIFSKKNQKGDFVFLERAWWTSIFLFFITQLFDVQYFDARISITAWIILSGLKLILEEKINSNKLLTFTNVKTIKNNL
jgi:O-antigen ligase